MGETASCVSRRSVIGALALAGLLAACSRPAAAPERQKRELAAIRGQALARGGIGDWERLAGGIFQVTAGFRLRLAGVRPLESGGARPPDLGRASAFLALFDVLDGQDMPGDLIYTMSTTGLGPLDVFLSRAPTAEFPHRMHAVFN